jgi:hypothetical protein
MRTFLRPRTTSSSSLRSKGQERNERPASGYGLAQKLKGPGAMYRGLCAMSAGAGRRFPGSDRPTQSADSTGYKAICSKDKVAKTRQAHVPKRRPQVRGCND